MIIPVREFTKDRVIDFMQDEWISDLQRGIIKISNYIRLVAVHLQNVPGRDQKKLPSVGFATVCCKLPADQWRIRLSLNTPPTKQRIDICCNLVANT
jgi:hypothetical protein